MTSHPILPGHPPLRPMLASPTTSTHTRTAVTMETLVDTHAFDVKLDGVRSFCVWNGQTARFFNRNGREQTASYPDLVGAAHLGPMPITLDGEIVAVSGSFEHVAIRDKQTKQADVLREMLRHPVVYIAFDMLSLGEHDMRADPWIRRRMNLDVWYDITPYPGSEPAPFQVVPYARGRDGLLLYEAVASLGMEGVIAKNLRSRYQGGRSIAWLKFKTTHRISCIAAGYEPGTGARSHFGAMTLALVAPDGVVECGRVGTGFTASEIDDLKKRLDNGDCFVVEIECLNVTQSGQLRFPVYKGIRSDLSVLDASIDQLNTIPRS
jgi:bifunctional non-homologous end joining protein LigD